MPGALLVPAGLGGVAAKLEVILEEMLEVRGLPTGRMPSTSCNESGEGKWDACLQKPWQRLARGRWAKATSTVQARAGRPSPPC